MNTPPAQQAAPPAYGTPISLRDAEKAVAAAEAEAAKLGLFVVIAVVDPGGHLICLHRLDNTQFGSIAVAEAKARSAVAYRRSTKLFEDSLADTPRILSLSNAVPVEGGLPLLSGGKIVGGIGVSGAAPHQDGAVAKAGAETVI